MTLKTAMVWLAGGGAGVATWAIVALLKKGARFMAWWNKLPKAWARILVFAFASMLGGGVFGVQIWIGYVPAPGSMAGWFEAAFAIVMSQVTYEGLKMVRRK